ncbi:MAG: ribonuclease III [Proteobacteria bacterium]|nr:ribonuclease III [Pseudomonadota bacterium]
MPSKRLDALCRLLGHRFREPDLIVEALTHPSVSGSEPGRPNYERLEFLGDRVLGLVVADLLFEAFPEEDEGALARRLAALVRRETLAGVAREIELGRHLCLSKGERDSGGADGTASLANACEAAIGALYRDGGLDAADAFIRRHWGPRAAQEADPPQDAKTALQEWSQATFGRRPVYRTHAVQGPPHEPTFSVEVSIEGVDSATGRGASKRAAEQAAAEALLARRVKGDDEHPARR